MQSCVCEKEQTDPGVAFVIAKKEKNGETRMKKYSKILRIIIYIV